MAAMARNRPTYVACYRTYSSADVAEIAGVSQRQVQWWDEMDVVSPRHQGHRRIYIPEQVVEVTIIAELRRKGYSLQKIRRILRMLRRDIAHRVAMMFVENPECYLLTDGKSISICNKPERIIDLLKTARGPISLVCISDIVSKVLAYNKQTE